MKFFFLILIYIFGCSKIKTQDIVISFFKKCELIQSHQKCHEVTFDSENNTPKPESSYSFGPVKLKNNVYVFL